MALQPCEGGEKENGSQSRYQLPDPLRKILAASLSFLSRTVGGRGAGVAWPKVLHSGSCFQGGTGRRLMK